MSHLNGFVACRASPYVQRREAYITGAEHSRKLKFSMQVHLTHMNVMFEYCHADFSACFIFRRWEWNIGQF